MPKSTQVTELEPVILVCTFSKRLKYLIKDLKMSLYVLLAYRGRKHYVLQNKLCLRKPQYYLV